MKVRTVGYFFRQTGVSLRRNKLMSGASVVTVAIALFVFGAFLLLLLNANNIATDMESNVEIAAYVEIGLPEDQVRLLGQEIERLPGVSWVELVPKEKGLEQLARQFGSDHDLLAATGGVNPLPDYFRVKTGRPEDVEAVAGAVTELGHIEKAEYGKEVVERLFAAIYWIRLIGVVSMALLAVAGVVLIALTVRLAVYARRHEVSLMKYVGATDWFIRWPFLLEGTLLGFLGSLLAVLLLYFGYSALLESIQQNLSFVPLVKSPEVLRSLWSGIVLGGVLVGAVGSIVSLRRFLQA